MPRCLDGTLYFLFSGALMVMRDRRGAAHEANAFDNIDNRQQRKQSKLDMQVSQPINRSELAGNRLTGHAAPQVIATANIESGAEAVAMGAFLRVAGCRTAIDSVSAGIETS